MVKFSAKLTRIGHSHGFIVPAAFVNAGLIGRDEEYQIEVETKQERLKMENNSLKRKLEKMNTLLKEKGIEPVFDENISLEEDKKDSGGRI